jgi:hypothetical protein
MKSIRLFVLMITIVAFSGLSIQAYAQQEVDPDHFDQPTTKSVATKSHSGHKSGSSHHHHNKMASKHSGSKGHHHQSRTA